MAIIIALGLSIEWLCQCGTVQVTHYLVTISHSVIIPVVADLVRCHRCLASACPVPVALGACTALKTQHTHTGKHLLVIALRCRIELTIKLPLMALLMDSLLVVRLLFTLALAFGSILLGNFGQIQLGANQNLKTKHHPRVSLDSHAHMLSHTQRLSPKLAHSGNCFM